MDFSKFESIMASKGVTTLADIARALETTPQAVSNWKSRDQVPYHIIGKLEQQNISNLDSKDKTGKGLVLKESLFAKDIINISDLIVIFAEQLKIVLLVPLFCIFITFSYVQLIKEPLYKSSSTILIPETQSNAGGLAGIASQFGVSVPQNSETDLSSPTLFPQLINSRVFAERIIKMKFYTLEHDREYSLLEILTGGPFEETVDKNELMQDAMSKLQSMVSFESEGSFSKLSVVAREAIFAKDLNDAVLNELQKLNRFFKSRHLTEKTLFINNRINAVYEELEKSEQSLKLFREQNRQLTSSPSLILQQDRLSREVEIQKGIYLTLKQQLELAKIEEVQESTVLQILDLPYTPLYPFNKSLLISLMLAAIIGLVTGLILALIRNYFKSDDASERRKHRRAKNFIIKKSKDFLFDYRVSGSTSLLLLFFLPFYLGYESNNPVFFGRYSSALMLVNSIYLLTLAFQISLFIYSYRKKILK